MVWVNDVQIMSDPIDVTIAEQIRLAHNAKEPVEIGGIEMSWDEFELVVKDESSSRQFNKK